MNTQNKPKTVGACAPKKTRIFSINMTDTVARIRIVNNAPQVEQEQRIRAD
jgi:hypothetical protein